VLGDDLVEPGGGDERPTNLVRRELGHTDDLDAGDHAAQSGRGLDAVQHREAQVQDDQSGGTLDRFIDRSEPVASLTTALERGGPVDELANGTAHRSAITNDEDSWCPGRQHSRRNY
jgi:hypothetical protein